MKVFIILLTMTVCLFAGCANQTPTPKTPCDIAMQSLRLAVLGANAYFIAYPKKADANSIAEVQKLVDEGKACADGLCADPNNPTFEVCLENVLIEFGVIIAPEGTVSPIKMPEK
jgi:hypothetical protein